MWAPGDEEEKMKKKISKVKQLKTENSVSNELFGFTLVMAALLLVSTVCLAISNNELTEKVRKFEAYFDRIQKEYEFNNACKSLHSSAFIRFGICRLNEARMETLEEIKQAELHINLGSSK
jgi:preprotein translocase subunit SecG